MCLPLPAPPEPLIPTSQSNPTRVPVFFSQLTLYQVCLLSPLPASSLPYLPALQGTSNSQSVAPYKVLPVRCGAVSS